MNRKGHRPGRCIGDSVLCPVGYVVLRFCCKHKEARRLRMYEKALDALATAPYAYGVTRFVLAGAPCTGARPLG